MVDAELAEVEVPDVAAPSESAGTAGDLNAAVAASGDAAASARAFIPTGEASFLAAANQPLSLSPNGLRTARFELDESGLSLLVEAAPGFGAAGSSAAVATARDVQERVTIIAANKLGLMGVRDLFWLDDRCFLITGYENTPDKTHGWVVDLVNGKTTVISKPSRDSSMFVPLDINGLPSLRRGEKGISEVLLGFVEKQMDGALVRGWNWFNTGTYDLEDAAVSDDLPTRLWRETVISPNGDVEAVLAVNGSAYRRIPEGWHCVGTVHLAASGAETFVDAAGGLAPRQFLVGAGLDYSVFAIDVVQPDSAAPKYFPPWEHLNYPEDLRSTNLGVEASASKYPSWVLQQCLERQTTALVSMVHEGNTPELLFAHPLADVITGGVWLDPEAGDVGAVTVDDLRPHTYALKRSYETLLADLRGKVSASVALGDDRILAEGVLEPVHAERHQDRWIVAYWHPSMAEPIALPALVEGAVVSWMGGTALPARGCALSAAATSVARVEGHRIRVGSRDVPVYLLEPMVGEPGALILRVHDGPALRDVWGADGFDSWLLGRGYSVLKVNYRGSSGYGQRWSLSQADGEPHGFLDDLVAGVQWALERQTTLSSPSVAGPPAVAVMGDYFGGYAVLQAMLHHRSLFACGVAVAPVQDMAWWPDSHIPTSLMRTQAFAARAAALSTASSTPGSDPAAGALSPLRRAGELREAPLLLMEFEKDAAESRDQLMQAMVPPGGRREAWPKALTFVQYAGEGRGGGMIRQNVLDQYRRVDAFLHRHLAPRALAGRLSQEPFSDELPFLSAAVLPMEAHGTPSSLAQTIESVLEQGFEAMKSAGGKAAGFAGKKGAASKLPPRSQGGLASRVRVRGDGTVEVTVTFPEEPEDLHVLLSQVWLHIRAKGAGLTLALPRRPAKEKEIRTFRLADVPGGGASYLFEISADPNVGAVENYNAWSQKSNGISLLGVVGPPHIAAAPILSESH